MGILGDVSVSVVQGYTYSSAHGGDPRDQTICKIVARAGNDTQIRNEGPAFIVQFGDGSEELAFAHELNPWYPVD